MTEYTATSESSVTPIAYNDVVHIFDASTSAVGKTTAADLVGGGTSVVDTTATTLAVTAASHAGRQITISSAAPIAVTLPAATGTGNQYDFYVRVTATATGHTIKVANATDVITGTVLVMTSQTTTNVTYLVAAFRTTATDDTITINGTTQGGLVGDWFRIRDVKSGVFAVSGVVQATGAYVTPFSASV